MKNLFRKILMLFRICLGLEYIRMRRELNRRDRERDQQAIDFEKMLKSSI